MIYDKFQQEAIDHIDNGHSVIVSAPTGAGKTAIAEHVIKTCLECRVGVIYTAPIKALSNQKFRDFTESFPDRIGILTGDVSMNQGADVLIMTTEIFRNKVLEEPESLTRYKWVIFDEIHYLDNPERGTVWEESLIFLPKHMNVLGLSATIPNISQFCGWIESIHGRKVQIVLEEKRPVPLHFFFQYANEVSDTIPRPYRHGKIRMNRLDGLVRYVRQNEGLPCIYFVFGRRRAEELAFELGSDNFLSAAQRDEIMGMFNALLEKYDLVNEHSAQQLTPLVRRGIAYHHAGMLPTLKETVERLFTSKLLKVIFTTETFALGINMPSRTVIFDDLRKYYGKYWRNLKTRDFYQMAGRAGRRGMDTEGFVYCRLNYNRIGPEEVKHVIYDRPESVNSQFNTSYGTLLGLYDKYKEELFKVYELSFHYYQTQKHQQKEAVRLMQAKLDLLKHMGYISDGQLTQKGKFARTVYGYELLLSELYEEGLFEDLDEFGLGMLAVATVFEPRKNQTILSISKLAKALRRACEETFAKIEEQERIRRIYPRSKMAYFHLSTALEYWLRGTDFSKIVQYTDTDEGEIVRYFRMAIQVMREMKDNPVSSQPLRDRITETIRVINRDVVDAEKQLREG
jgi:superfamily II RNA helicase